MKKYIYVLFVTALLCASCAKEEQQQPIVDDGYWPIKYGYLHFGTEVSSRASLVEDMKGKSFGVISYEYSSTTNWGTAKSTAKPGSFYNHRVNCDTNGVCTYDIDNAAATSGTNPKEWGEDRYAFFAYHPYGGTGIELSSRDAVNTPTLTYTYGWLNPTGTEDWINNSGQVLAYDKTVPIYDVMTAENVDASGKSNDRVTLDFKHRMFALEVLANNYNENEYKYITDANGNYVLDANGKKQYELDANGNKQIVTSARQKITNLTLKLEGLKYTSMTIPISMSEADVASMTKYTAGDVGSPVFKLSEDTVEIPAFNEQTEDGRGMGVATSISQFGSKNGGYLFLIPQEGTNDGIRGTLNWVELANFDTTDNEVSNEFESTIEFKPGKLYQVYINFVGSGITIAIIEAGNWDSHTVIHRFE